MQRLRHLITAAGRWGWFGLLVLLAFAYLTAGLSRPTDEFVASEDVTELASGTNRGTSQQPSQRTIVSVARTNSSQSSPQGRDLTTTISGLQEARAQALAARGLESASAADWLTVCRRMSLGLVGTGMSLEEIRRLERYPESERESAYLKMLLADPRFHDYWAERWTRLLVGTDNGPFIVYRRRRFRVWLSEQFAANTPYDQLVTRLVTANGLWTDNPEVNFLTATFDSGDGQPDPIRLAARTSRVFLGLRVDCLQCHDDFLGNVSLGDLEHPRSGLQSDFHQLAAFYSAAETNGLQGIRGREVDYRYKYLDAEEEVDVQPAVPYQPELLPEQGSARARLAAWITAPDNRQAGRAAVSHVWALMFGRPLLDAVDDLPLDQSSPEILSSLTDDFIEHGYDLRRLIRLIASSSAFRVDSRASFEITPEHERYNAVFPLVRLRPEQVAGSVIQAARIKTIDHDSSFIVQLQKFGDTNDFVDRYGDLGEDEFVTDAVTISQRLLMLNGKLVDDSAEINPILNATAHIAMFAADDPQAVETIYLAVLNRYPDVDVKQHFVQRLQDADERNQAIVDLWWDLTNSSEFVLNH